MVGSVTQSSRTQEVDFSRTRTPDRQEPTYTVRRGDTMSEIARDHSVTLRALETANPHIRNSSLIFPGDTLNIPGNQRIHVVERGDTFSQIAHANGVSTSLLEASNPHIRNIDRIYPGDRIAIPNAQSPAPSRDPVAPAAPAPVDRPAPTAPVTPSGLREGTLSLSAQDVTDLKKTLQTEWVQSAGIEQAEGIVDTILNRQASGRWGDSVADVVNARNQFSDVNGPVSRRQGRDSVDDLPASRISQRVDQFVDAYLAQRAGGQPSRVGDHLNFANPNYSDAANLGWINALDGPVLGSGDAIHRHGTVPELDRYRPGAFTLRLP